MPIKLQKQLTRKVYKHPLHKYPKIHKTLEKVKQIYQFLKIKTTVNRILKQCNLYGKNKAKKHKPYGELQPLLVIKRL